MSGEGEKERPGEGAEKRKGKKGGGRERKKIEYIIENSQIQPVEKDKGMERRSGRDWSSECLGESLTLRTHSRARDQAKEMKMELV